MQIPPAPNNERERLKALYSCDILDTPQEQGYDDLTRLAAQICETPVALVSLVDGHRQWFKSRVGLDALETPRDMAFCAHAILQPDSPTIVPDALDDARFVDNPLVVSEPGIRFYAGAPVLASGGEPLGTLCIIDFVPRELTEAQLASLQALARQCSALIELRALDMVTSSLRAVLRREQARAESLQEQLERANALLELGADGERADGLTQRQQFDRRLQRELDRAARHDVPVSVAILDVDRMSGLNECVGHTAGDEYLRRMFAGVRSCVRSSDFIAQDGGRFLVILPRTDSDAAFIVIERCREAVQNAAWNDQHTTLSAGLTTVRNVDTHAEQVIAETEQAVRFAKRSGRNRLFEFSQLSETSWIWNTSQG